MTIDTARGAIPRAAAPSSYTPAGLTLLAGCAALIARPASSAFVPITLAVALAGALHRTTSEPRASDRRAWLVAVAGGIGAFALVRAVLGGSLTPPPPGWFFGPVVVAAVAEEAFFRRFAYDALLRWGAPVALAVTSFAFAIVHVTLWGWRAVPVDLAAGALLGWQRWATGTWTAPAVTHAAANLVMLL